MYSSRDDRASPGRRWNSAAPEFPRHMYRRGAEMSRHHISSKISRPSFARITSPCACGPRHPFGAVWGSCACLSPTGRIPRTPQRVSPMLEMTASIAGVPVGCVSRERYQLGSGETSPQSMDLRRQITPTYTGGGMVFSGPPAPRRLLWLSPSRSVPSLTSS